jgi:transposase
MRRTTRRGHHYISPFVDIDRARVVFATAGKDAETVAAFAEQWPSCAVAEVCIDMSPALIAATASAVAGLPAA